MIRYALTLLLLLAPAGGVHAQVLPPCQKDIADLQSMRGAIDRVEAAREEIYKEGLGTDPAQRMVREMNHTAFLALRTGVERLAEKIAPGTKFSFRFKSGDKPAAAPDEAAAPASDRGAYRNEHWRHQRLLEEVDALIAKAKAGCSQ